MPTPKMLKFNCCCLLSEGRVFIRLTQQMTCHFGRGVESVQAISCTTPAAFHPAVHNISTADRQLHSVLNEIRLGAMGA